MRNIVRIPALPPPFSCHPCVISPLSSAFDLSRLSGCVMCDCVYACAYVCACVKVGVHLDIICPTASSPAHLLLVPEIKTCSIKTQTELSHIRQIFLLRSGAFDRAKKSCEGNFALLSALCNLNFPVLPVHACIGFSVD